MTEKFIDTLDKNEIYRFMRNEYDLITNNGEDYNVDEHDTIVAEKASQKFSISPQEAGNLYVDFEMKIADFQQSKLIENQIVEFLKLKNPANVTEIQDGINNFNGIQVLKALKVLKQEKVVEIVILEDKQNNINSPYYKLQQ